MPDDLYYCYVEDYFSDKEASRYIDNKCYYPRMLAGMKQPKTIVFRMGGLWLDAGYNIISPHEVLTALSRSKGDLIMKIAENSERCCGVFLYSISWRDNQEDLRIFEGEPFWGRHMQNDTRNRSS